jgi:hypothetical protein
MADPESPGVQNQSKVWANDFSDGLRKSKYMLIDRFSSQPMILQYGTQAAPAAIPALPTAVVDGVNVLFFPDAFGHRAIEMYQTTAQTAFPSIHASKGLLVGGDLVNNEGLELVPGGNRASNPLGYLAGTDPGVLIRATIEVADASGSDQLFLGWRKQENYVVPVSFLSGGDALYTDFVGIGFSGSTDPNKVQIMSDIGNAGSTIVTDTGFTFADNGIHQIEVRIKGRRASFNINGGALGDTIRKNGLGASITAQPTRLGSSYTVTSGLFMVPTFFHRYDLTTPGNVYLRRLEIGPLAEVGLQPENRT